jgi:hypothetical protein
MPHSSSGSVAGDNDDKSDAKILFDRFVIIRIRRLVREIISVVWISSSVMEVYEVKMGCFFKTSLAIRQD